MKKTLYLKLFLALILMSSNRLYADDIWKMDFSENLNQGYWGSDSDFSLVTNWHLDISCCTLVDENDYVRVVETSGGRLEAKDCDGEAVWSSKLVDISGFTNISVALLAAETGSSTNANKYLKVFYQLDGAEETLFETNSENIGNWGSLYASQSGLNGANLTLIVRLNNPNSGDLVYIDNVVISGDPIVPESDNFTHVTSSDDPIESIVLDSKLNEHKMAAACFRFQIDETGSAGDGLSTKISRMTFYNSHPEGELSWKECFGGISLYSDNEEFAPQNILIEVDSITMNFAENQIDISDGGKREFELRVFVKSGIPLNDGDKFQFQIKDLSEGFQAYASGSGFDLTTNGFTSPIHSIGIEASQIRFSKLPDTVIRNQYFPVLLSAVDDFGNRDIDAVQSVVLSVKDGTEILESESGLLKNFIEGETRYDSLKYSFPETINLVVTCDDFPDAISDCLVVENTRESNVWVHDWEPEDLLISSLMTKKEDETEVIRFTVKDAGNDNVSTILEKISLIGSDKNQVNWEKIIESFSIKENGEKLDSEISIEDATATIRFSGSESRREILSEDSVEFSVFCFLKEGKTIDGEILQMEIDSSHADWLISNAGSGLLPVFEGNMVGPRFTFDVKGEEMIFSEIPKTVDFQTEFGVVVQLEDRFGNIDTNSEAKVALSLASGSGEISSEELVKSIANGEFRWNDLLYSKAENFTILAECDGFSTILSDNISGVDKTSLIKPNEFISEKVLNPMATEEEDALSILNFQITDEGTHDELPTILSCLNFYNSFPENSLDWEKHIAGAVLFNNEEILASTTDITENYIRFNSSKGVLGIPNNSEITILLGIFFRKGHLPDNSTIQVGIPKENHAWKTLESGSEISELLPENITSEIHFINVEASKLSFLSHPFGVSADEKFSLKIGACDFHQNIDVDAKGTVQLRLLSEDGDLVVSDDRGQLKNGLVEFDSIQYTGTDDFSLVVDSGFESDTVKILLGEDELGISEDFESKNIENWLNNSEWMASSYDPINGNYSLKHNLSAGFGSGYVSIPLSGLNPDSEAINWSFIIRNGDWDPSSGNYFVFHLLMDNEAPEKAASKYSVGVNLTGSEDLLSLWNVEENQNTKVLLKSAFNWNENEGVAIQVSHYPNGLWQLKYNRLGVKENWIFAGEIYSAINSVSKDWFSGLDFTFETASRAGDLWFDDLEIESINTAPFLESYEIASRDSLKLEYSEELDFLSSSQKENFKLSMLGDEPLGLQVMQGQTGKHLILVLDNNLETGNYLLKISNISDVKGAIQKYESVEFEYLAPANPYNVVINEIMADENPSVGLPEHEYLELYNTKEHPISVENWKLKVGEKETILGKDTIPAFGYLILCSSSAVDPFLEYGNVLGVSSFPGLTNSGATIEIQSAEEVVIDHVAYSDSWYQSVEKLDGGWSLERIDPLNTAWQQDNWMASQNKLGGTPGKQNSIYSENPDLQAPSITTCKLVSENSINLIFSEPLEPSESLKISNYQLSSDMVYPTEVFQTDIIGKEYQLFFQKNFVVNQQYQLILSEEIKDLAGNSVLLREYDFWVPAKVSKGNLVINEVLFNPYPDGSDYIEILNISDNIIDMKDIRLGTKDANFNIQDTVVISEELLHPQEYLLVTEDTVDIHRNYFTSNPDAFRQIKSLPSYNDDNGRVIIISGNELIDDFAYNEKMHFDLLVSVEGVSLERINPQKKTNNESNWQSAAQNIGFGTPGLQNSVYNESDTESTEVSLSSKIFSPDNDGIDDRVLINFNMEEDGYLVSIRIYNSTGKEIRKLATNVNLANEDILYWDGLTSQKERAPIGIYLVYIELFNLNGDVRTYKKTCVLGGKFK